MGLMLHTKGKKLMRTQPKIERNYQCNWIEISDDDNNSCTYKKLLQAFSDDKSSYNYKKLLQALIVELQGKLNCSNDATCAQDQLVEERLSWNNPMELG